MNFFGVGIDSRRDMSGQDCAGINMSHLAPDIPEKRTPEIDSRETVEHASFFMVEFSSVASFLAPFT